MNSEKLTTILNHYVEKFDEITYEPNQENYKWEIAHDFRALMDEAMGSEPDKMLLKLQQVVSLASNLLSNQYELPGNALCEYIRCGEHETVRDLLKELLSEDKGDLELRQKRIDAFVSGCNALKVQYFPTSYKFDMGQRAAMVLLGLYDPDSNYLYKPSEANEFADCVEFLDEFGPSTHFKLSAYYRMCDELVAAMQLNEKLMAKHYGRFLAPAKPLHEDKNLRILAFDVIYSGTRYKLYDNIEYSHISTKERREYLENSEKAQRLADTVDKAKTNMDLYEEAAQYYAGILRAGTIVEHRLWGKGTIMQYKESQKGGNIRVAFPDYPEAKNFNAESIVNGLLKVDADGLKEKNEKYKAVLSIGGNELRTKLNNAEEALRPYEKYLS